MIIKVDIIQKQMYNEKSRWFCSMDLKGPGQACVCERRGITVLNPYFSYVLSALVCILAAMLVLALFVAIMTYLEKSKAGIIVYIVGGVLFTLLVGRIMGCEPHLAKLIEQATDNYYTVEYTKGDVAEDIDVCSAPNGESIERLYAGEHVILTGKGFSVSYEDKKSEWLEIKLKNGQKGWIDKSKVNLF